jgi:hypothetical protein
MATKTLNTIRCCAEFLPAADVLKVPHRIRGIYTLLQQPRNNPKVYNVIYIGMSRTGVRTRLRAHKRTKKGKWTHFSIYSVCSHISNDQITELEGILRAIFRRDSRANKIAIAKGFKKLKVLKDNTFSKEKWLLE